MVDIDRSFKDMLGELLWDVPEERDLMIASGFLYCIYGWLPKKVGKMRLSSVLRWCKLGQKKMNWEQALRFRTLLDGKRKKTIWQTIFKINS